jgi:hypothetical protein
MSYLGYFSFATHTGWMHVALEFPTTPFLNRWKKNLFCVTFKYMQNIKAVGRVFATHMHAWHVAMAILSTFFWL